MKISTKGRYALRFMIDLAQNSKGVEGNIALKDVSARQGISVKYLEQIVTKLCKCGLLYSRRGPQGGYALVKAPEEYSVGEILRTIEGKMAPVACLDDDRGECPRKENCVAMRFWTGLDDTINNYINSFNLAQLAEMDLCDNENGEKG